MSERDFAVTGPFEDAVDAFRDLTGVTEPASADLGSVPEPVAEEVIRRSGAFDEDWYAQRHTLEEPVDLLLVVDDVESPEMPLDDSHATSTLTALEHYRKTGVPGFAAPNPVFDSWWYAFQHLGADAGRLDPLLHHVLVGARQGNETQPTPQVPWRPGAVLPAGVRRACLLAVSDPYGSVDDTLIALVSALARYCDVFVLLDGVVPAEEVDRLRNHAVQTWARPHGRDSLGGHGLLALYVGLDVLDGYDEVVLADDSGYLVGDLAELFDDSVRLEADWWAIAGLGAFGPDGVPDAELERLGPDGLAGFRAVGPLMAFRRAAWRNADFRRLLGLAADGNPLARAGFARRGVASIMMVHGHSFASILGVSGSTDPMVGPGAFDLLRTGWPLLSKQLLSRNPHLVPGLAAWSDALRAALPSAPVTAIAANLRRTAPDDAVQRAMTVTVGPDGVPQAPELLEPAEFVEEDRWLPKFDHWWAFPVCAFTHRLTGNERAVFEEVAHDPAIKKIVLTRSRPMAVDGENVVVVPLASPEGQQLLLRSGQIFVKHGARINVPYRLLPERHNFINLWHGVPLKRFGLASLGIDDVRDKLLLENARSRAVIASSDVDRLAMTAAFEPLNPDQVWVTGLPRYDFVRRHDDELPPDLSAQLSTVRALVGGRRLVLFCPTFRDSQELGAYQFSESELAWLSAWQRTHDVVLGIREHMADTSQSYLQQLSGLDVLDLSARRFPDVEVVYRVASALVSDYSSCLVDFMSLRRPVVSFAYDYDHYQAVERGLFYELDDVLPGPVCRDFDELASALVGVFETLTPDEVQEYDLRARIFFDYEDDMNARRVVERVKRLYVGGVG